MSLQCGIEQCAMVWHWLINRTRELMINYSSKITENVNEKKVERINIGIVDKFSTNLHSSYQLSVALYYYACCYILYANNCTYTQDSWGRISHQIHLCSNVYDYGNMTLFSYFYFIFVALHPILTTKYFISLKPTPAWKNAIWYVACNRLWINMPNVA